MLLTHGAPHVAGSFGRYLVAFGRGFSNRGFFELVAVRIDWPNEAPDAVRPHDTFSVEAGVDAVIDDLAFDTNSRSHWALVRRDLENGSIGVLKLGHIAFHVSDPKAIADFYARVLGFRVSDWIADFFVFMRCNADHHTVNFITGQHGTMHHIAFELRDFSHLQTACDLFGQHKIPLIWGPLRLGPVHNVAAFHRNTDDWVVEVYAELDQMKSEELGYYDPRPWHRDRPQRPKVWRRDEGSIWGVPPAPDFFRGRE